MLGNRLKRTKKYKEEQPVFPDPFLSFKHCWVHGEVLFVPCAQLSLSHTDLQSTNIVLIGKNCPKSNETH